MAKRDNNDSKASNDRDSFQRPEDTRRNFLKKIELLGLGTLLYSIPTVGTFAQSGAALPPSDKFQMRLPATYSIKEPMTLDIKTPDNKIVAMKFNAEGTVRLTAATQGLANIQVVSLVLTNSEPNALASKAGEITARISNAAAGQLNLKSGLRLGNPAVPVELSFADKQTVKATSKLSGGSVAEQAAGAGSQTHKESNKCTANGNNVSGVTKVSGKAVTFTGVLAFGAIPQA